MEIARLFAPCEKLARTLLPDSLPLGADGAHDISHLGRVWRNVHIIAHQEGGDLEILLAATLLHDCVPVPKDSPRRSAASSMAAEKASAVLTRLGWASERVAMVAHAIEAHSFSAGIEPRSCEAMILQDADRLDAIGYVGIARCFHVSGQLGRAIYSPEDPAAVHRELDDLTYTIDHFQTKLLRLSGSFKTAAGRALAAQRHDVVKDFFDGLIQEISVSEPGR